ncbi:MAG TPA: phosphoribosylformylglycinamidine synthase subunit PurS [Actinomycetota bacterium]|nr:phosphoribosylformylglycinamidine synthase subunit PurS [Actinomycetota bacterium]
MRFHVSVNVMPKEGISDPQGQTIERSLPGLGFDGFSDVRVGKRLMFEIEAPDRGSAETAAQQACEKFLTNPIIEQFEVSLH